MTAETPTPESAADKLERFDTPVHDDIGMQDDENGGWVHFDDAAAVIRTLESELSRLRGRIKDFLAFGHPSEGSKRYHLAWEALQNEFETNIPLAAEKGDME